MNKTNLKKIKSRYNGCYIWWGVFLYAMVMLAVLILTKDNRIDDFVNGMIGFAVILLVFVAIAVVLASLIRSAVLKKRISAQGDLNSFNNEVFMEVGYSRHMFVSQNWLLWNRGMEYRIFHRNHIRGAFTHPNQRPGNKYAVCDLYLDSSEKPLNLYYDFVPGIDLPGMLQGWLTMSAPQQQVAQPVYAQPLQANPQPVATQAATCPVCHSPLKPGARFCTTCGTAVR